MRKLMNALLGLVTLLLASGALWRLSDKVTL